MDARRALREWRLPMPAAEKGEVLNKTDCDASWPGVIPIVKTGRPKTSEPSPPRPLTAAIP